MKTIKFLLFTLVNLCILVNSNAQRGFGINSPINCGTDSLMKQILLKDPAINQLNSQIESRLLQYYSKSNRAAPQSSITTLPLVVHIIHNNGAENISDARVLAGIQHLNDAFANTGYYDPSTGVNTNIQFCLAQRDPQGQGTTGITRNVSPYTNMGGPYYNSDDINVKNINRWNPNCYINIWLVNSIPGPVAGYATFPAAHGSGTDGILLEAEFFGSGYSNDVVIIHEMGHYLGLYHTFEQGCTNNNCVTDGDKVCDTPPDNSTSVTSCNITVNSCSTDVLSGFATDQNDLTSDYLDYGNWDCMSVFTQGQSDRMNWHIMNVRSSLLACNSCVTPCPGPVTANFTKSANAAPAGTAISFTNTSGNGTTYSWYVNGVLTSTAFNFNQVFTQPGTSIIRLVVRSSNPALCVDGEKIDSVKISCPVKASFTPGYNGVTVVGQNVTFTNNSIGATTYEWYYDNNLISTTVNFTATFNTLGNHYIKLLARSQYCVDSLTVYYLVNAPATSNISFQKRYSGLADFQSKYSIITPDQNVVMLCGNDFSNNTIVKCTGTGNVLWAKSYLTNNIYNNFLSFHKVIFTNDGNLVFIGRFAANPFILKTDMNGNIIWNKYISEPTQASADDVIELPDGSVIISGDYYGGYLILYKVSASGQLLWRKTLAYGSFEFYRSTLQLAGNDVYLAATIDEFGNAYEPDGFIMKINPINADIIFGKTYDYNNYFDYFNKIQLMGNKLVVGGYSKGTGISVQPKRTITLTDLNGNLTGFKLIDYPDVNVGVYGSDLFVDSEKGINFTSGANSGNNWRLFAFDSALVFKNAMFYPQAMGLNGVTSLRKFSNGDFLVSEDRDNGNALVRTLPDMTRPSCATTAFIPDVQTGTPVVTDITSRLAYSNNFPQTESVLAITIRSNNVTVNEECNFTIIPNCDTNICNIYKLSGPTVVCRLNDTFNIKLNKSANCNLSPSWAISGTAGYNLISQSDSIAKITVTSAGNILVKARTMSTCKIVEDSFFVQVNISPSQINLGQDIQLCNSSTLQLHAGKGFRSYLWQDGSVDSTFTAYMAGTYFVKAFDYCGNAYSDTIIISIAPNVAFDLGANKEICEKDTITITAPPGFSNYKWSPNYAINNVYTQTVKLWPARDTVYTVTAEKTLGCTVLDSIRIKVNQLRIIALGNDTSFCQGGSVTLNPGNNFMMYLWNTGITSQSLIASAAGMYSVAATDSHGCISRDTMNVVDVFPNPVINLGPDKNLCENGNIILNAGSGFQGYSWQDNSVNQTYTVTIPGQYWVKIKNSRNCVSADTINILSVVPHTVINLGADTSLCEGQSIILSPGPGFSSYTWQDNSHSQSHVASLPGQYWVTVTDSNSCSSNDTLRIIAVLPKPAINIGSDTILCQGQTITLNAGNGFAQYVWSNNTTNQFLNAGSKGSYWVKVSDNNGCSNADTMQIKDIIPPPYNFVHPIYDICTNEKEFIKPLGSFNYYLWSDGSTSDSVLISMPGNYWLTVTNTYGCKAKENFEVVIKTCINAIYFPNSFTPNKDNLNETFKPGLYGSIEQYHLEIFNRFGQRVFGSYDYSKGWDGIYNSLPQDTGVYIWICSFKVKDKPRQIQKGSVVLIR